MDENKEKNESLNETEKASSEDSASEQPQQDIHDEMENLAKVFQQELDKTSEEAKKEVAVDDTDAVKEETEETDGKEPEEKVNENLCQCCGENEKVEGKNYCEDCLEAMRHYPFKWVYFLFAAVLIYLAVMAGIKIVDTAPGFTEAYKGDVLAKAKYYSAAQEQYTLAENHFYKKSIDAKLAYKRSFETAYKQGNLSNLYSAVTNLYSEWELNLPHMKTLKKMMQESQVFVATASDLGTVMDSYSSVSEADLPYNEIIEKMEQFRNATLYLGYDENGEITTTEEATTSSSSSSSSDTASKVYFPRATKYDDALISYYEYYVAKTCNKSYEERIKYLEKVKEEAPDKYWLYAGELGAEYAINGKGEEAKKLADDMIKKMPESSDPYVVKAVAARVWDKDYDAALSYCDEGLQLDESYELYRQKALVYLAQGDYKSAQEQAQEAYESYDNISSVNTLALCALANGDSAKYDEMKAIYDKANEYYGETKYDFPDCIKQYMSGAITIKDIVCAGGYDVV